MPRGAHLTGFGQRAARRSGPFLTADPRPVDPRGGGFIKPRQAFGREVGSGGHESDIDVWQVCSLPAKQLISDRLKRTWERLL